MIELVSYDNDVLCVRTASEQNGQPIFWVYSYLVGDTLFDTGCGNTSNEFRSAISTREIGRIVISHAHEDHVGACSRLESEVPVLAPDPIHAALRSPPAINDFFRFVWGQPEPIKSPLKLPDNLETERFRFSIVRLPGHTDSMIGLYDSERQWLFSADAVPFPSRKKLAMPDENIPMMLRTLEMIQQLDISVLFDSHHGPIDRPHEHVQKRIDFLKETQSRVRRLYEEGLSIEDIVRSLNFEQPWYVDLTGGRFGVEHLVRSLIHDK
ncbi:MAG: MBL fold metallo-hydrolase [Candidatus Thorarchaeota archaeon]